MAASRSLSSTPPGIAPASFLYRGFTHQGMAKPKFKKSGGLTCLSHLYVRNRLPAIPRQSTTYMHIILVYAYICLFLGTCTPAYMLWIHMCIYIYICLYVHMHVCMYVCTYVCMYVCMYVCTCNLFILSCLAPRLTFVACGRSDRSREVHLG